MSRSDRTSFSIVAAVAVLAVATAGVVGVANAQSADTYTVRQDGQCTEITPLDGNESVKAFYDYRSTIPENPYTTRWGPGFSSEGTTDLQEAETSVLFLYEDPSGVLSLVAIHDAREEGADGGAASFDVSGLPADGSWVVKDDEYDSPENVDRWRHDGTTADIDWAWSRSATDGGAFAGLGDDFDVTIDPAFNGEAELFVQSDWGVVEEWAFLSGDRANPERISLDRSEPVSVSTESCG